MADAGKKINPPFSPPDCPYVEMKPGSDKPEDVAYLGDKLDGDEIYVGRVYDNGCYLVGTAIPSKGICIYLSKNLEIKSTDTYDIVTTSGNNPLAFRSMALGSNLRFTAGGDEDNCLYCARVVDGDNAYYGWADPKTKTVYIPREESKGPNKLKKDYDILVHTLLDRLCICPPAPRPPF